MLLAREHLRKSGIGVSGACSPRTPIVYGKARRRDSIDRLRGPQSLPVLAICWSDRRHSSFSRRTSEIYAWERPSKITARLGEQAGIDQLLRKRTLLLAIVLTFGRAGGVVPP